MWWGKGGDDVKQTKKSRNSQVALGRMRQGSVNALQREKK